MKKSILLLAFALATCSAAKPTPASGCTYPTTIELLDSVAAGDVITADLWNSMVSCVNATQVELGTDPSGSYGDLGDRLDALPSLGANATWDCAVAASCKRVTAGVTNGVIYASNFPGADIGARTNAALGQCNSIVGAGAHCEIHLSPGTYTIATAIQVNRSNTTLDCQGATIAGSASYHDIPIRINEAAIGTLATSTLSNIAVRNCVLSGASQVDVSSWDGGTPPGTITDQRSGYLSAYDVDNLSITGVTIADPPTTGIWVQNATAALSNIAVIDNHRGWATKDADGVVLIGGETSSGVNGLIRASNVYVQMATKVGVRALDRTTISNVNVVTAGSACISTEPFTNSQGVGDVDPGDGIAISNFGAVDCNDTDFATNSLGSGINIEGKTSSRVEDVMVSNGYVGSGNAGAITIDDAQRVLIQNVSIGCWGQGVSVSNEHAILLTDDSRSITLSGLTMSLSGTLTGAACGPVPSGSHGIHVGSVPRGPISILNSQLAADGYAAVYVDNVAFGQDGAGTPGRITIANNYIADWTERGVGLQINDGFGVRATISNNRFFNIGSLCATCGAIDIDLGDTTGSPATLVALIDGNDFAGNTGLDLRAKRFQTGDSFLGSVVSGNSFLDGNAFIGPSDTQEMVGWLFGTNFGPFIGANKSTPPQTYLFMDDTAIAYGQATCLDTAAADELIACGTATTQTLVVGISSGYAIVTGGYFYGAACEGTVNIGDLVGRSGVTVGAVAADATPAVGEAIGIALSTCSGGVLNLLVGKQ